MKRLRLLGLGARLASAGGRATWARLALMAVGFCIGSALLLSAASIVPVSRARDNRMAAQYGTYAGPHPPDAARIWWVDQSYGDLDIEARAIEAIGNAAPVPPGLPRIPRPGEIFVSERLRGLWDGGLGSALERRRLHGRLVGTIGPEGVEGPDELFLWIGKPAGVLLSHQPMDVVRSFDARRHNTLPFDLGALLLTVGIASALLLPIWLFVATATRLSAATRDARLAAVRLAGGTQKQVRFFAAVEVGVAAGVGASLGFPLYILGRARLANGVIAGIHFYPSDFTLAFALSAAILIALPLAAVLMTLVTMRRLVVSPLGVARHVRRTHAGWRWSLVLAAGIGLLTWCASQHAALTRFTDDQVLALVGTGLACAAFGLVGTATWSAWAIAGRLAGFVRSVPAMLGFRRLEAEPTSVSRVVGGVALMIAVVGVVQSGLITAERDEKGFGLASWTQSLPADAVLVRKNLPFRPSEARELRAIPGVDSLTLSNEDEYGATFGGRPTIAVVVTDGSPDVLEAIRDRVVWTADAHTIEQLRARAAAVLGDELASERRAAMAITLFLLLVSAATLLVAMVDWMMERRRPLAVLSAVGVGNASVRRSIFVQVALPLASSIVFGVAGAITVIALLNSSLDIQNVVPVTQLAILVGVVVVIVLAVTGLCAPWLSVVRRPELLREA